MNARSAARAKQTHEQQQQQQQQEAEQASDRQRKKERECDEYGGRCRKHPWESRTGVCPICLKNRLILLCPHCANIRPCLCFAATTIPSSSASTSTSSSSSSDLSLARISFLIDSEPPFRRSRSSAAFQFLRHRPADAASDPPIGGPHPRRTEKRRWVSSLALLLSFLKPPKKEVAAEEKGKKTMAMGRRLTRSRSMGFSCYSDPDGIHGGDARLKGRGWIPSPMKVFRQPKPAKILQERSPLCRG
ncbi:hypothetical protein ACLOJK_033874 [Asimina triloba]